MVFQGDAVIDAMTSRAAGFQSDHHLRKLIMKRSPFQFGLCLIILTSTPLLAPAAARPAPPLSDYFPPPEEQGGWRTLLPAEGEPDDSQKARIREVGGVDWDALKAAWDHNAAAPGATGLLVIRR